MFGFHLSYRYIHWRRPTEPPPALPEGIERLFVPTPGGKIELLYAAPKTTQGIAPAAAPILFIHGGMGSAGVWLEYMGYLAACGVPCYAVSLRGHGESWCPSFFRMVYGTTKRDLADDAVAAARWIGERDGSGQDIVLVGHSSGGGLSQFILSEGELRVKGLALSGAVPGFGSMGVYINWWLLDPFFSIRMLLHLWHPNSPLSHPALTRRVFFNGPISDAYLARFQRMISPFESFWWPLGMMKPFVNSLNVLQHINGWGSGNPRVLVLHGENDRLMTWPVMRKLAAFYRDAFCKLVKGKKLEAKVEEIHDIDGEGGNDTEGEGVRFCVVPSGGHHMQNDVGWEVGAQKLLDFYRQL